MAAVNTKSFDFDEELRRAQEAARKAEEEAKRAQEEAEEQARRAQEETQRAAQEAEQAAADSAKQAQSAQPDVLPEVQETPVPMPDAQAPQTDLDALFMQDIQGTVNDTRFKVSRYDEVNGYYQGMANDELKGKIVSHASGTPIETGIGNDVYIDFGSVKSPEQAYMLVMLGTDNKAKNAISAQCAKKLGMRQDVFDAKCENYIYDTYGRQVYSTPKSDAGKNRYYMQGMSAIGLMDTNGDMLDMTLATPQDVMHACRMEPDGSMADTAYALAKYGSKVPGNMWYGMTVTKDMFTFVDSAELTKKDYDAEVSAFDHSFSYSDMDGNKTAYLDNYQYILDTYGGNQRVFNSMLSALNKSFTAHTQLEPPGEEQVKQALAQAAQAVSTDAGSEEEQKKHWWDTLGDWVKTNLLDLPSAEGRRETERKTIDEIQAELDAMEAKENAPEQDGAKGTQSSGSSVISSGGVTSVGGQDVSFSPPVASAAMTSGVQTGEAAQDVQEMQAPSGAYKKSEVQGPIEQKGVRLESAAYDPNMSDVQAWMLHQQGYMLDPRNQAQIEKYLAPEVRGVLTNERGKTGSGFEISEGGAAWPVAEVTGRRRYGPELGEVMGLLGSTSLDGEALALAQLQTMDIVSRLQEYAATPYTPERPQGVNAYTWALSQNPEIAAELSTLKKQIISGNSMHGEMVANDAQERDARMQGYVQAALSGSATPEMLASLSEYYASDMIDVQSDESRNKMSQRLYGNGALFATDSDFWDGDSLAAAEGRNIRTAGGMQGFLDFCDDMTQRTQDILDSFTTAANRIGMTLEDYMGSAGITDIRQIADIAYNEIRAQGAAILDSPEMIAEVDAAVQNPVGLSDVICGNYELSGWEATKLGAGIGWNDYWEGFCQTSYMVMDAATYTQTRQRLMGEYYDRYGEAAPQMYRRDLNRLLAGDTLSDEMKAELSRNMDGAQNIFDLAYEIDPSFLKGAALYTRAELGKKVEKLQAVKDMLTPEQQVYVDFFAGGTNSLTGMAVNAVAAGAGALIGAPAAVAKTAGALLGTGFNAFEDAYDENFHARGMDREHAATAAFGDAVFMTATEYLTPDLATDLLFGGQTQQAMVKAARKSPASFFRTMAKTTFARALDEGKEEVIQTLGGHVFNILDNLYIADQNGEKVTPSLAMKTVLSGFANTDWGELGKETLQSGLGGFGYGLVFGLAGTAAGMLPGGASRAALADGKAFRSYESVKLSCGIADGSVEASTENLGRLYTLLGSDLQDPKFCMYIDRSSQQAATSRQVMTAMLEGEAADALERAGEHADKAKAYGDKADAAKAAVSQSQEDYMALRETVSGGEIDKVPALEAAQQRWAKAQTAYNEASEAANKERDKAGRSAKEWLDACMAKAQTYTAEGMKVQMNRIAALRDGMARRLDTLYTQMEQARGTYETELARSADLEAEEMTDEEIDAAIGEMADVENRAQQAQEMGMDEDTVNAIREQGSTDESRARREAIIRNQRNEYASLQSRMQTAQELSDTDAYDQLKARQDIAAQRLERLGVPAVDPNAEANARQAANRERIRDVATGTTAQQREEARVRQQEAANIREMDADAYIEQNHPDASEEDKAKLRDLYGRIAGEQTASAQDEPESMPLQDGIPGQGAQEKTGGAAASTDGLRMMARLSNLYGFRTEVVEDDDPRLKGAEGGYERSTNTMYIPKGITQSQALVRVLAHELTHFAENGTKSYDAFQKALLALRYGGDKAKQDADAASIIRQYNEHYRANNQTNADGSPRTMDEKGALSELTAKIMAEILSGNQDMITRLTQKEPGIARRIADTIRDFIGRLRGVKGDGIDQLARVERMFRRALKKAEKAQRKRAGEYRMAAGESSHPGSVQFSVSQLAEATGLEVRMNDDGVPYSLIDKDGNDVTSVTPDMLTNTPIGNLIRAAHAVGTIDQNTADAQMQMFADLTTLAAQYKDQAMVWEIAGSQMFSAIKDNSDKQYGTTVDFGTICAKTQAIVDVMSETMVKLGRGLTRQEVIDAYRETAGVGYNVPCPVCYVFSRWMGVPSLLGNMASYQDRFSGMSESEVRAYVTDVENRYSDGSGKPSSAIAKAKSRIEGKLARIEKKMLKLTAQGKSVESLVKQAKPLEDELSYIEAYNWVTQVLCKKNVRDANGQVVLDPDYTPVPKDILLDLRKTGEFANDKYKKSWTYRTTRGAGMGKAILPHSGARIGDTVKGTKDRWTDIQNAFLTGDDAQAQRAIENAIRRMKAQNLIGGQRFQSTSDYRPEWGIDYMMTFLEMQAIGAKGQLYTKVIEAVDMFATAGIEVNLSIMPKGNGWHVDENGNKVLDFSSVTGIDFDQAYEKTRQYDNVQMILVGINDDHIELAMADDRIGFIIPWHASGNSGDTLTAMMDAVGEKVSRTTDYTRTQSDKANSKATQAQKNAMDLRMRILTGDVMRNGLNADDHVILESNPYLADLYNRFCVDETETETYGVSLSSNQASQVFPFEYWDTSLNRDQADENGRRFVEYCESIGLKPRFPQFADKPGYWKLLIDRPMYNLDGTYHHPKQIDVSGVEIGSIAQSVGEVKYGDSAKTEAAAQAVLDDIRARLPAEQFAAGAETDMQDSLPYDLDTVNASAGDDIQYALPSDDVLEQEIRAWMNGREAQLEDANRNDGVSRFAADTVQRIEAVPVRVRQEFDTNPILRSYRTDSNADQISRATDRIESAGYQNEVDRLLEAETFNADDNVEAGMIALAAFENGDIRTGLDMALKYRIAGTEQGKALQSRKVLSKMTPTHMALKLSADMEQRLADTAKALPEKAKDVNRRAADAQKALSGLSPVDEMQRILNEGGTIDRRNNVQGAVVNEQQRAAIKRYGLEKTVRKIDHYNRATLKQRMLEFILDTPDLSADTGNGITGYQRLEWMKEGKAVMTSTDLRHIMAWATAYGRLSDEEQAGHMGDILMGRIAEAYVNMTPATSFEKARTSRFVNMLLSLPSAERNVLGNGLQNAVNAVTHDTMEVGLDKLVSLATGKRTKAELTFAERAEGWRAFVDETVNTFHDYFVDEVDTAPRDQDTDRFDSAKRGRVYQGGLMHGAQQIEGFLMSFGDRNFYKRAYVNSINEQMRVAEMNGLEPDMDAILLQAKQDADYATFNEDGGIRRGLSQIQRIPYIGPIFSLYCPFTGVPTNIAKRGFVEYSPLGAVFTIGSVIKDAAQGRGFNQRRFVEGMARSVTGSTMLLGMGYLMAANGMYYPGTGDEEDQNVAALRAAEGQQYSPFIRIGDTYVSLGAFAPAIYPVTIGATIYNTIKKSDGDRGEAIKNAMIAISNQFFDSTFMSGLTEVFNTQNSTVPENIIATLPKTAANQMVPFGALLSQVATGLDTYARDTKDASVILRAMKDAAARIPFLREQVLDVKTDITGRPVESKPGLANNLLNPLTTTQAVDDPALTELDRLYDALGTSAHIPSTLIKTSGKVTILAAVADNRRVKMDRKNGEHNLVLTAAQRNQYNRMYAGLCFDGTGNEEYVRLQGIDTRFTGIRDLMETPAYKRADDQEKAGMISDIIKKAKQLTHAQMVYDLGYTK